MTRVSQVMPSPNQRAELPLGLRALLAAPALSLPCVGTLHTFTPALAPR